jgi:ribose transport system permease protein
MAPETKIQSGVDAAAVAGAGPGTPVTSRLRRLSQVQEIALLFVLVALCVFFSIFATNFTTSDNIRTVLIYLSVLGVLAAGQTLVIIGGGFDLSNGANLALSSTIGATMLANGQSEPLAVIVTVAFAAAVGLINGLLVAVARINPFITTLATYLIANGAAYVYTNSQTVSFPLTEWVVFGRGTVGPIPVPVLIMLGVFVACFLMLRYTTFGRSLYAIGGNVQAAQLAGLAVRRNTILVYVLSGICAGIGALIQASLGSAGSATFTGQLNLQSITAVILGGTALTGGEGGVWGTLVGVLIMQTILNGLTLMNISSFFQDIVTGIVLLLAVLLGVLRSYLARR